MIFEFSCNIRERDITVFYRSRSCGAISNSLGAEENTPGENLWREQGCFTCPTVFTIQKDSRRLERVLN